MVNVEQMRVLQMQKKNKTGNKYNRNIAVSMRNSQNHGKSIRCTYSKCFSIAVH